MVVLRCKVAIVGEATVGKSAMVQMFHTNGASFPKNYLMTQGVDFCVKEVAVPDTDATVELYIFDISGQQIYSRIVDQYVQVWCLSLQPAAMHESGIQRGDWRQTGAQRKTVSLSPHSFEIDCAHYNVMSQRTH